MSSKKLDKFKSIIKFLEEHRPTFNTSKGDFKYKFGEVHEVTPPDFSDRLSENLDVSTMKMLMLEFISRRDRRIYRKIQALAAEVLGKVNDYLGAELILVHCVCSGIEIMQLYVELE